MGRYAVAPVPVHIAVAAASLMLVPTVRATAATDCPGSDLQPKPSNLPRVEAAIVCLLNAERARVKVHPLVRDRRLDRSAAKHTDDMTSRGYFAHQRRNGPSLLERIRREHYFKGARSGLYSENLGYAPPERASAASMTYAFSLSESHRKTMLYGRFRDVGVGSRVIDPSPSFYSDYPAVVYTIDFGRRYERRRRCPRSRASDQQQDRSSGRSTPPRPWCRRRRGT